MKTPVPAGRLSAPNCCEYVNRDNSASFFKALSDTNRLHLIYLLLSKPGSVQDLAANFSLHSSVISRHLKILKEAGIVISKRNGKEVVYSVCTQTLADQLRGLADALISSQLPT